MSIEATREQLDTMLEPARKQPRIAPRTLLVSGLALAAVAGGALWIAAPPSAESTDDAYVAADATTIAPKVRGLVAQVLVRDNQQVHAGDPLVRIDPEEFDARTQSAQADLSDATAQVASAQAALASLSAEQQLASATIAATRTTLRSTAAEQERSEADRRRFDALVATGAVARHDADAYRSAAITAQQASAHAQAMLAVSERESGVVNAKHATLLAALDKAEAVKARAAAALNLARQDQGHTLIHAAVDGVVGNRQVRVGDYVQAGTRLLTLVPVDAVYVTANFKETQTRRMREGQSVTVDVDALDGPPLKGHVESLAPGSGSTFALLPFEPGTGNFTKIVQRVPVRIRFDPGQSGVARLRPGLSVTAKVRLVD